MNTPNPATPAQAATPGSNEPGRGQPAASSPAPATGAQGGQPAGTVTISTDEYAKLQRNNARYTAIKGRQHDFKKSPMTPAGSEAAGDPDDPVVQQLNQERQAHAETKQRLYQIEVREKVQSILAKPEYKGLPESTRNLIMKNPAMLSEAPTLEEALLDIEDFVREEAAAATANTAGTPSPAAPSSPKPGNETPPVVSAGAPASGSSAGLEDVTGLTGTARARALIRNAHKKARGVVA